MWMYRRVAASDGTTAAVYQTMILTANLLMAVCAIYALLFFSRFGLALAVFTLVADTALIHWQAYYVDRQLRRTEWGPEAFVGLRLRELAIRWLPWVLTIGCQQTLLKLPVMQRVVGHLSPRMQTLIGTLVALGMVLLITAFLGPLLVRLFLRTRPLPDGPLRQYLAELGAWLGTPVGDLRVSVSPGGRIANAWVTGLWGRQRTVILSDHLLQVLDPAEIGAVFAHEVGHARLGHLPKRMAVAAGTVAGLAVLSWLAGSLPGAPLVLFLLFVTLPWLTAAFVQRRFELAADRFAAERLGPAVMASALRKIAGRGARLPGWLIWIRTHPPLEVRLAALGAR